ncbi:MAG: hypothetical protein EAZ55_11130 [Cytophagales bacterium]|nr:MAG: hypothetical protein EAZ55_11130 [Cytophagales bacterium]
MYFIFIFLFASLFACAAPSEEKTSEVKTNPLGEYLKTLPEKKLPFVLDNQFKDLKDISELGFTVLYSAQDAERIKQGQNFGVSARVLFWYQLLESEIVGIVTIEGAQVLSYMLTTFNRTTGERIATTVLGTATANNMAVEYKSTCNFEKNGSIVVKTITTTNTDSKSTEEVKTFLVGKSGEINNQ